MNPTTIENDSMVGRKLGNYKIMRNLGLGGMGVVYHAIHSTLNREVAIKFLASQFSTDPQYIHRFVNEAQTAAQLKHPNIIGVFDAGVYEGIYYFVMEYVKGRDLSQLFKEKKIIEEHRAIRLMQRVASGLAYAHGEGILHRDIKPGNLFLTPEGQIKIGDLGLAIWVRGPNPVSQTEEIMMGTPFYISPEQIRRADHVDGRTDIYSLGATFFHLVTGRPPFPAETAEEAIHKHLSEPAPWAQDLNSTLSEPFCHILMKMMAKNIQDRFQNMDAVIAALNRVEEGGATEEPSWNDLAEETAVTQPTMMILQKRLHGRTDFPSLASTMNVMSKLTTTGENTPLDELIETVLSDFALTNKILKLANSAFYSAYAGKIATISHAIMVLGLAQVRNAAVSLLIFENMQSKLRAGDVREVSIRNFLAGAIARNLGAQIGLRNKEEAYICAVFHHFGRLLATFYLPEEDAKILSLMIKTDVDEQSASRQVLGLSYQELGSRIANEWNLPEQIIFTMQSLPRMEIPPAETPMEQLHRAVCFSNHLAAILRREETTAELTDTEYQELFEHYEKCFKLSREEMDRILESSLKEFDAFAETLGLSVEINQGVTDDDF